MISKFLKNFSQSLEQFFLTVGQNNFGNKIPFPQHCAMTINQSRGEDGKFALAKGAQRGLYSRPIPHRPRIEITFFFLFLSFSKHFAHATNQTSRHAGHFTTRRCILENILQTKFSWKIIWEDYVPKSGNILT